MQEIGKFFLLLGAIFIAMGILLWIGGKIFPFLGNLPGDIRIEKGNFTIYIPIASSILISILLTVVLNLILWLVNKH